MGAFFVLGEKKKLIAELAVIFFINMTLISVVQFLL